MAIKSNINLPSFDVSVTKQQLVKDGQCSRRDWTTRLISTATGPATTMALVIWLERDKIHRPTSDNNRTLRVDLKNIEGNTCHAECKMFVVISENFKYRLVYGSHPGKTEFYIYIQLWEIVANAVGKCSLHMNVERNTVQND